MNIIKFKKQITSTLTIVMFMTLTCLPLVARARKGSLVVVTMNDGSQVNGELLAVKSDTLLIFNHDADRGMSLDLRQVDRVKVTKKSKFGEGLLIGLVVGVGISFFNSHILKSGMPGHESFYFGLGLYVFPPITGLCGGLLGSLAGIDKKLSLAGESLESVQQNLKRLKRFARESSPEKTNY